MVKYPVGGGVDIGLGICLKMIFENDFAKSRLTRFYFVMEQVVGRYSHSVEDLP